MDGICYLDNSATTPMSSSAQKAMAEAAASCWGNPSSLHSLGVKSEKLINSARESVAKLLACDSSEIFFTASGTEANNIAIFGAATKAPKGESGLLQPLLNILRSIFASTSLNKWALRLSESRPIFTALPLRRIL